jgi:hypothetical protein
MIQFGIVAFFAIFRITFGPKKDGSRNEHKKIDQESGWERKTLPS